MEWDLAPRTGGAPVHIHPHAAETYEVLEGELDVYVAGAERGRRAIQVFWKAGCIRRVRCH